MIELFVWVGAALGLGLLYIAFQVLFDCLFGGLVLFLGSVIGKLIPANWYSQMGKLSDQLWVWVLGVVVVISLVVAAVGGWMWFLGS